MARRKRDFGASDVVHRSKAEHYLLSAGNHLQIAADEFASGRCKRAGVAIDTTYRFLGRVRANIESIDGPRDDLSAEYLQMSRAAIEFDQDFENECVRVRRPREKK